MAQPNYPPGYPPPPPYQPPSTFAKGCVIAGIIALAVPSVMLLALFVLIIGVCGHWR